MDGYGKYLYAQIGLETNKHNWGTLPVLTMDTGELCKKTATSRQMKVIKGDLLYHDLILGLVNMTNKYRVYIYMYDII